MEQERRISDLWFVTEYALRELVKRIGLENSAYNVENYWEWIVGGIGGERFNISRTHRLLPHESDTRVMICGASPEGLNALIERLQGIGIAPIYIGQWRYVGNEEFEKRVWKVVG